MNRFLPYFSPIGAGSTSATETFWRSTLNRTSGNSTTSSAWITRCLCHHSIAETFVLSQFIFLFISERAPRRSPTPTSGRIQGRIPPAHAAGWRKMVVPQSAAAGPEEQILRLRAAVPGAVRVRRHEAISGAGHDLRRHAKAQRQGGQTPRQALRKLSEWSPTALKHFISWSYPLDPSKVMNRDLSLTNLF